VRRVKKSKKERQRNKQHQTNMNAQQQFQHACEISDVATVRALLNNSEMDIDVSAIDEEAFTTACYNGCL